MTELSIVGKSVPRVDALVKVTGSAKFVSDMKVPGMLYAKVLRSPYPHAKILSIDTSKAEKLSGVVCIVTGKDAPEKRTGSATLDQPVLARDVVCAVGDPVAAVAATTLDIGEKAVELIDVKYQELPAVFDPEDAVSTHPSAVVHPDLFKYEKGPFGHRRFDLDRPNVMMHYSIRRGDVEKGFKEADLVMENKFTTAMVQHCPLEMANTIAVPENDGSLTIYASRQLLQPARAVIRMVFGMEPSKLKLAMNYTGGGFGRGAVFEEPIAALLALKARKPVKLAWTREEVFLRGGNRIPMTVYIKDGVKKDGTLVAREMTAILPSGPSEAFTGLVTRNCAFGAVGTYRVPNFKWDSYGVYINGPTTGGFRGLGSTQVEFAIEQHMDMLAEKLGIDPVEIRRKNLLKEGEPMVNGEITHSIGVEECLNRMAEFIKMEEEPKSEGVWRRGKGIAVANKYTLAPTAGGCRVKIMEDGSVALYHGAEEIGQGCDTVMAQIAAEELGVPVDRIKVQPKDTLNTPYSMGSCSSQSTFITGNGVRLASQDAKRRLFDRVAPRLGVSPDQLEIKDGVIQVKGMPDKKLSIPELFTGYAPGGYGSYIPGGEIIGNATYVQVNTPDNLETGQIDPEAAAKGLRLNTSYAYSAKAVEVAVNIETGQVKVERIGVANDMGQPINPKLCEQQAEGGIGMAIGASLTEEFMVQEGKPLNPNFHDYRMASVSEMPPLDKINLHIAPAPHKDGPYGAKGFSEGAMIGIDAAIANAVYRAIGIRIKDLPITPEKVLKALKEKGKKGE